MFTMLKKGLFVGLVVSLAVLTGPLAVAAQNGNPPADAPQTYGEGFYFGNGGTRGARRGGWMRGGVSLVDATAEVSGMTVAEVIEALKDGASFADLAPVQDIVDYLMGIRSAALSQAVADGRLTREDADTMLAQMEEDLLSRLEGSWAPQGYSQGFELDGTQPLDGSGYRGGMNGRGRGTGRTDRPMAHYENCPLATE